jgi:small-conductance mechanosensitive channel
MTGGLTMHDLSPAAIAEMWRTAWSEGLIALLVWLVVLLVARRFLMIWMSRIAARTAWTWDDVLLGAIRAPSLIAIVAGGLVVFGRILPLEPEWDRACDIMLAAAISLAIVLFVDRATSGLLDRMERSHPALQGARGLVQGTVRGIIIGIGLLIFLDSIGISIAPILASLGVGSLAVALALQETLANMFAGLHLVADKPIEPGHFIRLQSGEEGHVQRVGWRSTWIRTAQNNTVVVPNSKLAGGILTNFDLPTSECVFNVDVTVAMQGDLDGVEWVTRKVANEVQASHPAATPGYEPALRFTGYAESGIRITVLLSARTLKDSNDLRHEFLKQLTARYRSEGIVIPFPTRTLDVPPGTFPPGSHSGGGLPDGERRG